MTRHFLIGEAAGDQVQDLGFTHGQLGEGCGRPRPDIVSKERREAPGDRGPEDGITPSHSNQRSSNVLRGRILDQVAAGAGCSAAKTDSDSSYIVSTTILTSGCSASTARVASIPFIFGIPMSIRMTSSPWSSDSLSASSPDEPSPTTTKPSTDSSSLPHPVPENGVVVDDRHPQRRHLPVRPARQERHHPAASAGRRSKLEGAPEFLCALAHRTEADPGPPGVVETGSVIRHLEEHAVAGQSEPESTPLRIGVSDDVRQGLLRDPVGGDLDGRGERREVVRPVELENQILAGRLADLGQRGDQSELVQGWRWQRVDEAAHIRDHLPGLPGEVREQLTERCLDLGAIACRLQLQSQAHELRSHPVMQVPPKTASLLGTRVDQALARLLKRDREQDGVDSSRDMHSQLANQSQVFRREGVAATALCNTERSHLLPLVDERNIDHIEGLARVAFGG